MEEEKHPTRNSLKAEFYDTSHPDIDSNLESYFNDAEYSFKSRKYIEVTYYAMLKMRKNGSWIVHEVVQSSEVELFNDDELITVLIEKIVSKKETRKITLSLLAISMLIAIPCILYGVFVLGISASDEVMQVVVTGGIILLILPIACVIFSRNQRKIDSILYSTRADYIQTLQKRADAEENPYIKKNIVKRIDRLKMQSTHYT